MDQTSKNPPLFIGIDCGTQSLRVSCFDKDGMVVSKAIIELRTEHRFPYWAEQNADAWWEALVEAMRNICKDRDIARRIASIGICGTSSTVVPCDSQMHLTGPAILWMDNRASKEADELRQAIKTEGLTREISSEHLAPKLLWLARNHPIALEGFLVECVSWLVFRLTGHLCVSYSITNFLWGILPHEWVRLGTIGEEIAPYLHAIKASEDLPTAVAGEIRPEIANLLGMPGTDHRVIVAVGGNDALLSALGAGLLREGPSAVEVGGTSYVLMSRTKAPMQIEQKQVSHPITDPFESNSWIVFSSIETAGLFLNWLTGILRIPAEEFELISQKMANSIETGVYEASSIKVNINLLGEKQQNASSGGGILANLTTKTTREELLEASLETIALMAWKRMEWIASACLPPPRQVFVAGGFSSNPAFLRLRASLATASNPTTSIYCVEEKDVGCRGAAMCGACAIKVFPDLFEASKMMAASSRLIKGIPSVGLKLTTF